MASKVKGKQTLKTAPHKAVRRGRTSTSKLSSKNQVTLPVGILRATGIEPGDLVSFEIKDGLIVIKPLENVTHPLRSLIGAGGDLYDGFDLAKERSQMWPE